VFGLSPSYVRLLGLKVIGEALLVIAVNALIDMFLGGLGIHDLPDALDKLEEYIVKTILEAEEVT
jgi:hypothetical protein